MLSWAEGNVICGIQFHKCCVITFCWYFVWLLVILMWCAVKLSHTVLFLCLYFSNRHGEDVRKETGITAIRIFYFSQHGVSCNQGSQWWDVDPACLRVLFRSSKHTSQPSQRRSSSQTRTPDCFQRYRRKVTCTSHSGCQSVGIPIYYAGYAYGS